MLKSRRWSVSVTIDILTTHDDAGGRITNSSSGLDQWVNLREHTWVNSRERQGSDLSRRNYLAVE